jgi:hypothetical protein
LTATPAPTQLILQVQAVLLFGSTYGVGKEKKSGIKPFFKISDAQDFVCISVVKNLTANSL